jgi:chromosome segregation ATPase
MVETMMFICIASALIYFLYLFELETERNSSFAEIKILRSQLHKHKRNLRDFKVQLDVRLMKIEDAHKQCWESLNQTEQKFEILEEKVENLQRKVALVARNVTQHSQNINILEKSSKGIADDLQRLENVMQQTQTIDPLDESSKENIDDIQKIREHVMKHNQKIRLLEKLCNENIGDIGKIEERSSNENNDRITKLEEEVRQHRNNIYHLKLANNDLQTTSKKGKKSQIQSTFEKFNFLNFRLQCIQC